VIPAPADFRTVCRARSRRFQNSPRFFSFSISPSPFSVTRVCPRSSLARVACTNLSDLRLDGTRVTTKGLESVSDLRKLRRLSLRSTSLEDGAIRHLSLLRNAETLHLDGNPLTDLGLAHLARLKSLRVLTLSKTKVTDDGLKTLSAMKSLREIDVRGTQVTPAGIEAFQKAHPACAVNSPPKPIEIEPWKTP